MKKIVATFLIAFLLAFSSAPAFAQKALAPAPAPGSTPADQFIDLVVVRPFSYLILVGGLILYPPFLFLDPLFRNDPKLLREDLIDKPYRCAVERPFGKLTC